MKKTPIVTVVVCTYSRKDLLYKCLESLVSQTVSKNLYEVLVIDNNSKDNTQEVVKRFIKTRVHIRNIKADIQGLSHARNIGWNTQEGDMLLISTMTQLPNLTGLNKLFNLLTPIRKFMSSVGHIKDFLINPFLNGFRKIGEI